MKPPQAAVFPTRGAQPHVAGSGEAPRRGTQAFPLSAAAQTMLGAQGATCSVSRPPCAGSQDWCLP